MTRQEAHIHRAMEQIDKSDSFTSLETAALRYAIPAYMKDIDENFLDEYPYDPVAEKAFIAGARWQKECVADSSKTSANEDESIRKFLVDYFTSYKIGNVATKLNGVRIDDILNYLEKQKEKPNIEICPHSIKSKSYKEKPAECIEDSIEFKEGFKTGRETGLRDGQNYILDNLESYGLYKSAGWSEEDKDKVIQYLHDRDGGMLWSKATDITRDILDMLRPSWKPSENQMSMLLAVVNDPNNAGSASCYLSLKSLYNDLKKL